ncbi:MAG: PDDEXK nuclease domain-containing protein [Thermodesulfobacteriota bacterium]|nr:PDDEXK nuclease domain-containing protein [Thermodesulfobacteriota bacterium]
MIKMKLAIKEKEYRIFLGRLKEEIISARQKAYQTINRQLVELYLRIGRGIYEKIEVSKWGEGIVEALAGDLHREFPDMKGFSKENLWRMKKLHEAYKDYPKLSTLLTELPWSHNILILNRTDSIEEKEFYLKSGIHEKWSFRELERQIDSSLFERYMISRKTDKLVPHTKEKDSLKHFKDEYVFDFLGLKDDFVEGDLRKAIVVNLKQFFLEFGKYFTFVNEEYRITVGGEDYKVDLLFYHRVLRCLVAVELKIGKFKPEYVGKMQFYLSALDEKVKLQEENPSVGLILCKSKDGEVVRIAVSRMVSPMKVATYKTKIIDQKLLKRKLHSLPLPEGYKSG